MSILKKQESIYRSSTSLGAASGAVSHEEQDAPGQQEFLIISLQDQRKRGQPQQASRGAVSSDEAPEAPEAPGAYPDHTAQLQATAQ